MPPSERISKPEIDRQDVDDKVLVRVAEAVRRYFGPEYVGASATDAAASAYRMLLEMAPAKRQQIKTIEDLEKWLVRVAWRKYKDGLKKSHRDRRRPFPLGRDGEIQVPEKDTAEEDTVVDSIAGPFFTRLVEDLDEEQRIVLDGKRQGKSHEQIAAEQGWQLTEVDNKSKHIFRKARKLAPEFPENRD